jgi:GTPase SAR1 family protein
LTASLEDFQSEEQRRILDIVAQIRKCGLHSVLSLPQIVVCGEQSAGKSSVLEALTEIPFPRQDNLCTRFATAITLRRGPVDSLTLRVIPAPDRPAVERATIEAFAESIADFADLPTIMDKARAVMGLAATANPPDTGDVSRPFARDTLSIVVEGPDRPQFTLVDLPGLVQANTKGVTTQDRMMVEEITDFYIKQPRTICLAVVSATHDYANQLILTKVREFDPNGERTLGVITKPDRLEPGSGREASFISLARNEDVFFKLGWHVIKNRKFEERDCSIDERNTSEVTFFRNSNFKDLPTDIKRASNLRGRLSVLLFEHIKRELPNLKRDLDVALSETSAKLAGLGTQRSTAKECRLFLTSLSITCCGLTAAAVDGHYEGDYFKIDSGASFELGNARCLRRFRAAIQFANRSFTDKMDKAGAKYMITADTSNKTIQWPEYGEVDGPEKISEDDAIDWVKRVLVRSRGKEPIGSYNPLIIGELFWEQSTAWGRLAEEHLEVVANICQTFLDTLLAEKCPEDVQTRLNALRVADTLKMRFDQALKELRRLLRDKQDFPMVYNHYYTDTVQKKRNQRWRDALETSVESAISHHKLDGCHSSHTSAKVDVSAAVEGFSTAIDKDMERYSCKEILDHVASMYKVR